MEKAVSGVAKVSARLISEHKYFVNFSASRIVKFLAMLRGSHPSVNIFFQPDNLGALPALWLQAKLTISLTSIQDKFAKLFMTIAAELWLRGRIDTLETVFQAAARNFTIQPKH